MKFNIVICRLTFSNEFEINAETFSNFHQIFFFFRTIQSACRRISTGSNLSLEPWQMCSRRSCCCYSLRMMTIKIFWTSMFQEYSLILHHLVLLVWLVLDHIPRSEIGENITEYLLNLLKVYLVAPHRFSSKVSII